MKIGPLAINKDTRFWFGFFWNTWERDRWEEDIVTQAQWKVTDYLAQCYLTIIPCFPIVFNVKYKSEVKEVLND